MNVDDSAEGGRGRSLVDESAPMCLKDLRLKESAPKSNLSSGEGSVTLDFLRSLCAHENNPPDFLGGGSSPLVLLRVAALPESRESFRECWARCTGSDLVESAPLESP